MWVWNWKKLMMKMDQARELRGLSQRLQLHKTGGNGKWDLLLGLLVLFAVCMSMRVQSLSLRMYD
jgi:hypothetical protein